MKSIENILDELGPSLSSSVAAELADRCKISHDAARQRLSRAVRANSTVKRCNYQLFSRHEAFVFLESQYNTERYWTNLLRDLREKNTVYACALDGIAARGGIVKTTEFAVISGAPLALKKQVSVSRVRKTLISIEAITEENEEGLGHCLVINQRIASTQTNTAHIKATNRVEYIILERLRDWLKKNNLGSYAKITIRGEEGPLQVGQFKFDLTAPCYLRPLREQKIGHGFVAADVFASGWLQFNQIKYFLRKIEMYEKTSNSGRVFPILLANRYNNKAFQEAKGAGIMVATIENLFGIKMAQAIDNLIETLTNAISASSVDQGKLNKLLSSLSKFEGRIGNMRGILFELISAYIAKREYGGETSVGVSHIHREKNNKTDLDVVCIGARNSVIIIECKSKEPYGEVSLAEIERWLNKIPVMLDYIRCRPDLYDREVSCEIWTSGTFSLDALKRLNIEERSRTKRRIAWKDGSDVRRAAIKNKLTPIVDALNEHFLEHPYVEFR